MYEEMTFEALLDRMLARVPTDVDKREGSLIYDALAPAAVELAQAYIQLDQQRRLAFASTSSGEWLEKRTSEHNIFRHQATYAVREMVSNVSVGVGQRFYINGLYYKALESGTIVRVQCERAGTVGNVSFGAMQPVEYIQDLTTVVLGKVLIPGTDTETDEALLARYNQKVTRPSTSGNKAHYEQWASEVPGVGGAKVYPLWNGAGTVKVVVVDADKKPASSALLTAVTMHIESLRPIGASVTVASAKSKTVQVKAKVRMASGHSIGEVTTTFTTAFAAYLQDTAFTNTYVSLAKAGTLLLSTAGVIDYADMQLNGLAANVSLNEEEVPVCGEVNLEVAVD